HRVALKRPKPASFERGIEMAVKKRGSRWHYAFMIRHVRYRGAIPEARTKDEATRAETEIRRSVYNGTYGQSQGAKQLINYAMEVYIPAADTNKKSAASDHYHVRVFQEYCGDKSCAEFSRILVERFKSDRLKSKVRGSDQKRQPSSVNRELACLSKIFSMAVIDGYASDNPCLEVK